MDDVESGQPSGPPPPRATPRDAKAMLRSAREASGLTLAEIATRTRVPVRHLDALEEGDYASLPSATYAVGFARAHARATGADEVEIARQVREELDRIGPRAPEYVPYETADPARVPPRGVAIVGAGLALAVLVLVALFYGTDLFRESQTIADTASAPRAAAPVAAVPKPVTAPTPTGGQVVLTATDEVWLRVYDADNKTLYLGTMQPGERYAVPADANNPMINVGRPDKLDVTLNGSKITPLGTGERPIKDVRVSGAAIAVRQNGETARTATTSPTTATTTAPRTTPNRRAAAPRPARRPIARLTETQRANLASARALRQAAN